CCSQTHSATTPSSRTITSWFSCRSMLQKTTMPASRRSLRQSWRTDLISAHILLKDHT
ncbi:hypothetical protein AMECASPLE_030409, partial [Ameca splendens]|nr:hypothetical protein [Ataeniobius toweri]